MTLRRAFPYVVGTAMVAAIAAGLVLIGSPSAERMRRLDEIRVRDLMQLANIIDQYWKREEKLPASLDVLADLPGAVFRSTTDPSTSDPYQYRALDSRRYELCAGFEAQDTVEYYGDRFWAHGVGRTCFELDAEKQRIY